ncbi:reverse transcriptase domain-containing protein [Tanacetum coccineum]
MIHTSSRIGSKKEETFRISVTCNACGKKGHYANQCSKANNRSQESILRDELNFVHFRISTPKTTLEDIQLLSESSSI